MLSWRDIKNPKAGGAESVTFELLRRFAKYGHTCTWFCSSFEGAKKFETIENVKIIRQGSPISLYWKAYRFLKQTNGTIPNENTLTNERANEDTKTKEDVRTPSVSINAKSNEYKKTKENSAKRVLTNAKESKKKIVHGASLKGDDSAQTKYDIVIDQINTIPFFTPLYYSGKKVTFFHQLCEDIWFYELGFVPASLGYLAEKLYLRWYNDTPAMTISSSTKLNLKKYGFKDAFVFKDCIDSEPIGRVSKKEGHDLVYVGRLKNSKRVHDIIKAFSIVEKKVPDARLHIAGQGDEWYEWKLKNLVKKNLLESSVVFYGYLGKKQRNKLMKDARAILVTSVKEGFGLIVLEANAQGTPAIVYNVDGLRDAVISSETGLITKKNNPAMLAKTIIAFLTDASMQKRLSENALAYSKTFDWDEEALKVEKFLKGIVLEK